MQSAAVQATRVLTLPSPQFKTLDWNVGQLVKKGFNADFLMYRTTLGSNPLNPLEVTPCAAAVLALVTMGLTGLV